METLDRYNIQEEIDILNNDDDLLIESNNQWRGLDSFERLQSMMFNYLTKEVYASPWHISPPETINEDLIALNMNGFIPTAYQENRSYRKMNHFIQERVYIRGIINKKYLSKIESLEDKGYYINISGKSLWKLLGKDEFQMSDSCWLSRKALIKKEPFTENDFMDRHEERFFPMDYQWDQIVLAEEFYTQEFYISLKKDYYVVSITHPEIDNENLTKDLLSILR